MCKTQWNHVYQDKGTESSVPITEVGVIRLSLCLRQKKTVGKDNIITVRCFFRWQVEAKLYPPRAQIFHFPSYNRWFDSTRPRATFPISFMEFITLYYSPFVSYRPLELPVPLEPQSPLTTGTTPNRGVPPQWTDVPEDQEYNRVPLPEISDQYKLAESLFRQSMSENKAVIVAIERVQNTFLWDKYSRYYMLILCNCVSFSNP